MIPAVPPHTRYRLPSRAKKSRSGLYGILAVLGLSLIGWIVWHQRQVLEFIPALEPVVTNRLSDPVPIVTEPLVSTSPPATVLFVSNLPPLLAATSAPLVLPAPPPSPPVPERPVQNPLEAQLLLARQGISAGSVDGVLGSQTRAAIRAFQDREGLPPTGELDAGTRFRLRINFPAVVPYTVTAEDLGGLHPISTTWFGKSEQAFLGFETLLELVAERSRSHPNLIRRLNPDFDWTNAVAGAVLQLPNAVQPPPARPARTLRIRLATRTLQAFDDHGNLLAHYPCSIAARVEKRPVGLLHVVVCAPDPNYTFNPEVFPESAEGRKLGRKLILPPGPNNPVGVAWIGLDRAGYGIHGTPRPEEVGRTESHGCFRLANWNAEHLLRMVQIGTPVSVEP